MKIKLIITGGTIDKVYNELTGKLEFGDTHIVEMLNRGRSMVETLSEVLFLKDSLEMTDADRALILNRCQLCDEQYVLITHGTDTMVDTAKLLGEKIKDKTIVLFGSMIPYSVDNSDASQAIAASTVAGTAQQNINFTREHEWEADRIGTTMLSKSGFNPKGMAHFFEKLKDTPDAEEFLLSHPLSTNRIADSMQRAARISGDFREDSFEYITIKAKLYYHKYGRIKLEQDKEITLYMQAYQAFDQQEYLIAKTYVDKLLKLKQDKSSYILAGRIASKLGKINQAQQYFEQNILIEDDEPSIYYAAQAYLDNQQPRLGIATLKPFLRVNEGSYQSYRLLSSLFVKLGSFDRSHIQSAKALIVQGKLDKAIGHYERAKAVTHSQDLHDVIAVRIDNLQQTLDLYKDLD